jgi:mRNA interferase MazF
VADRDVAQGEIFWVEGEEPFGSEPGFRRPWLVIQSNLINASAINTVLACPLTSNLRHGHAIGNVTLEPGEAGLAIPSVVQVLGLTALNRSELSDYIGQVSARRVTQVVRGIVSVIQPREP